MKVTKNLIRIAKNEALKSNYRYKIGAVIWKRKTLISTGRNYVLKSVRSVNSEFIRFPHMIHAEVDAIINAKSDLNKCNILVVRVSQSGNLAMAKPCDNCMGYITHVGIKRLFYSNREGGIVEIRI